MIKSRGFAFVLAVALLFALAIHQAMSTPIWSPRDEIAHFDYIDQLASFRDPRPIDSITDHTASLCRQGFVWKKPLGYDGSKSSMGLASWSYESQNPPLYYGILAPVHRLAKALEASGEAQVRILRIAGLLFFLAGALVLVPLFTELDRSFDIPRGYGYGLALIILATNHHYVATLGNDVLSIPLSGLALFLALRYWRTAGIGNLAGLAAAAGAASITKLTNAPLVVLPLVAVVAAHARTRDRAVAWHVWALASLAPVPLLLYLAKNLATQGYLLGSPDARVIFATFVVPVRPLRDFLGTLVADSFNLQSFGVGLRPEITLALCVLLVVGAIRSLIFLKRDKRQGEAALHLLAVATVLATTTTALILDSSVPGVQWHVFRHYYMTLPLWTFAFFVLPLGMLVRNRADGTAAQAGKVTRWTRSAIRLAGPLRRTM